MAEGTQLTEAEQTAYDHVKDRVQRICQKAHSLGIPILIDAEDTWIQNPLMTLLYAMMALYNKEKAIVFNTTTNCTVRRR